MFDTFPDLKAEKILREAYDLKHSQALGLSQVSFELSKKYSAKELADALATIATMFNWSRL